MAYLFPAGPYIPDTGYGEAPKGSPMERYRQQMRDYMEAKRLQHEAEWGGARPQAIYRPVLKPGDRLDPVLAHHLRRDRY